MVAVYFVAYAALHFKPYADTPGGPPLCAGAPIRRPGRSPCASYLRQTLPGPAWPVSAYPCPSARSRTICIA